MAEYNDSLFTLPGFAAADPLAPVRPILGMAGASAAAIASGSSRSSTTDSTGSNSDLISQAVPKLSEQSKRKKWTNTVTPWHARADLVPAEKNAVTAADTVGVVGQLAGIPPALLRRMAQADAAVAFFWSSDGSGSVVAPDGSMASMTGGVAAAT